MSFPPAEAHIHVQTVVTKWTSSLFKFAVFLWRSEWRTRFELRAEIVDVLIELVDLRLFCVSIKQNLNLELALDLRIHVLTTF